MTKRALLALLLVAFFIVAACSTQPIDQMAGQQPVRVVASAWNSTATTEAASQLRDTLGQASEGTEVPVLDKDGKIVLDGEGKPVLVRVGRGLRDVNFFFGEVSIENSSTVQGTASGVGQTGTPTTTITPQTSVTVPASSTGGAAGAVVPK